MYLINSIDKEKINSLFEQRKKLQEKWKIINFDIDLLKINFYLDENLDELITKYLQEK